MVGYCVKSMSKLLCSMLLLLFVLQLCASCSSSSVVRRPMVIAHRGGAALAPENTLLSLQRGMEAGADMLEVDVRCTADGYLVLMHDSRLERTTNGRGYVAELSYDSIASLSIVDAVGNVTSLRVPTLDEALEFVAGRCGLLIEVKGGAVSGVEQLVIDVIRKHNAEGRVAVQSFSDDVLERFWLLGAAFPLEKLIVFKFPLLPYIYDGGIRRFDVARYSHISSFNINRKFTTCRLVEKLHGAGKYVKVWTFKGGAGGFSLPVDAVITDSPHLW